MARFTVTAKTKKDTYNLIPEGTYVFKIMDVEYNKERGIVSVTMQTKDGRRHWENFYLTYRNGDPNPKAEGAWFYFVRTVLGKDDDAEFEFDTDELLDKYVSADLKHTSYIPTQGENQGKTVEKERLTNLQKADGFEGGYVQMVEGYVQPAPGSDPLAGLEDILT